jgi:hypothetical protein
MYIFERSFVVAGVEAATSMILEVNFGWESRTIGFVTATAAALTTLFIVAILLCRRLGGLHHDLYWLLALGPLAVLGTILFVVGSQAAWCILLADVLIYTCAFSASGITDGLASRMAKPGTACSIQNYQVGRTILLCLARSLGPPLMRFVVAHFGWVAYGYTQSCIAALGCITLVKVFTLAQEFS